MSRWGPVQGLVVALVWLGAQISACQPPSPPATPSPPPEVPLATPEAALVPARAEHLALLWDDAGEWASLRLALEQQRAWFARQEPGRHFRLGNQTVSAEQQRVACERLLGWLASDPSPADFAGKVASHFSLFEAVGGRDGQMLITGYYEPIFDGCRQKQPGCETPIYGDPGLNLITVDLGAFDEKWQGQRVAGQLQGRKLVPYADRRGIREKKLLAGHELAWAKDPVDLFFVEVQGSGTVRLAEGGELRIGYANANGRPYRSIGKLLADEGAIPRERVSMQSIRAWLAANPAERDRILDYNPSMVFFRSLDGPAVGNIGLPVIAGRSVAADQSYFPPGTLGFLLTEKPTPTADGGTLVEELLGRFVVVQDTGGAIRGPGRLDFFWGRGPDAAGRAGVMKQPGRFFVLLPK